MNVFMENVKLSFTRPPQQRRLTIRIFNEICCTRFVDFKFYLINFIWNLLRWKVDEELCNGDDIGSSSSNNKWWWWWQTTKATTTEVGSSHHIFRGSGWVCRCFICVHINVPVINDICWRILITWNVTLIHKAHIKCYNFRLFVVLLHVHVLCHLNMYSKIIFSLFYVFHYTWKCHSLNTFEIY